MRTIETTAVVAADHTLTVALPADVPPGPCRVVVEVPDPAARAGERRFPFNLEMVDIGPWPEGFTASREQIYGDGDR
jgi:hypothetical protein